MHFKLNKRSKKLLLICSCVLLLTLSCAIGFSIAGEYGLIVKTAFDIETYRQQLTYIKENYNSENRIVVISERAIWDKNAIASAGGFSDMYVLQYATKAEAQKAVNYYNSLSYAKAMPNTVVRAQETTTVGDGFDPNSLTHLSWGADLLGIDNYQRAILQKYGADKLPEVYVAVLDTGIDTDNEFLHDRIALEYGESMYPSNLYQSKQSEHKFEDDQMHGTHVAGTIVDLTLPNVKIIPIKILDGDGTGEVTDIMFGIKHVMKLKADGVNVVAMNMSLAAESSGHDNMEYFDKAYEQNIMSVVAAGNESYYSDNYFPSNCPSALTVSALSQNAVYENFPYVAYYSNYGDNVDLCLPGSDVLSCVPAEYNDTQKYPYITSATGGKYARLSGTSMATPHASALVALYATYLGENYTTAKVEKAIKENVYDMGSTGKDDCFGYGVPSMDLALADRELPETPTLSEGKVGVAHHFEQDSISVNITNNSPNYNGMEYDIHYTLDGSYPTFSGKYNEYVNPIVLKDSTHLNFVIYLVDHDGFVRGYSKLYEIEYFKGEDEDKNTRGTGFEINDSGILTRYTSGLQDVEIPAEVNGKQVRALANNLFFGLNVRSIVCESDVILYNAGSKELEFPIKYCPALESVTLGSRDVSYAVSHCFSLKELVLLNATAIEAGPIIPSFTELNPTFGNSYTVYRCGNLEKVVGPHVKQVKNGAFNYMTKLKELDLPELNSIFGNAFIGCWGLREVNLPSLMYAYDSAFNDCYNLRSFNAPKLQTIGSYTFANCVGLVDIDTSSVTSFGERAMFNCMNLTSLDTSSTKTIGNKAFEKCRSLIGVDLRSLSSVGEFVFIDCTNLKAVYCGSNSYAIKKSMLWSEWIYRNANLQYIVTDYGMLSDGVLKNWFFTCTTVGKYKVYTRDEVSLYTATFLDADDNEISKQYRVTSDPLTFPDGKSTDEYQIQYLSWRSTLTGQIYHRGDTVNMTANDTYTLIFYNAYYSDYASQAKELYASLYKLITGSPAYVSDAAVQAVYNAIESACTVNIDGVDTSSFNSCVLDKVNEVIGAAVCDLMDKLVVESDSQAVKDIVVDVKANILNAGVDANDIVDLTDIVEAGLQSIEEQRNQDRENAKNNAKAALREITSEVYENLSAERKDELDELIQIFESRLEVAEESEYDEIISQFRKEFIVKQAMWKLDDLLDENTDECIEQIVAKAKVDVQVIADSNLSEEVLAEKLCEVTEQAQADIEEYLSSKNNPVDPDDPDKKDPNEGGDTEPTEPEEPGGEDKPPVVEPDDPDNKDPEENGDTDPTDPEEPDDDDGRSNDGDNTVAVAVGTTAGIVGAGAIGGVTFWFIRRRRRR